MKPRVVLADDETGTRQTLAIVLRAENMDVVAEAKDGIEALDLCRKLKPAFLLTDLRLPEIDGVGVMMRLRAENLGIPVLIYTGSENERHMRSALAAEPEAMVHKADDLNCLRDGIRQTLASGMYCSPRLARLRRKPAFHETCNSLTPSELELWKLIALGHKSSGAADVLHKAPSTVSNQREQLMRKLGVHDVTALVRLAVREGIIEP